MSEDTVTPLPSAHIVTGRPARVTRVSADQMTFYARLQGGGFARVASSVAVAVRAGDSVLLGDGGWSVIASDAWVDERAVGIVRVLRKKGVILETALGLRYLRLPRRNLKGVAIGNTVEFDEHAGITKVLAEKPLRSRDEELTGSEEFLAAPPDSSLTFASFGGYAQVVARATELVDTQLRKRTELHALGAHPIRGVILSGPPGTGKTYLAKIIAAVSQAPFYAVSGPSIVSKWVGDSEQSLRRLFETASQQPRAIIFFDEIDSIASKRGDDPTGSAKRLVGQLLTLMDGFSEAANVIVLAATNRIEDIDEALLRPGRFDWHIDLGEPTAEDRMQILEVGASKMRAAPDLPLRQLAEHTEGWTGAMLSAIWTESALLAVQDDRQEIAAEDLARAHERVASAHGRRMDRR